jgi:hypothetical protein
VDRQPPRNRPRSGIWGGAALLVASTLIAVKCIAILLTGDQPPVIFEVSPLFLGLGMVLVAPALGLGRVRRVAVRGLGAVAALAGAVSGATEFVGSLFDPAIGTATLAAILAAVVGGWRPRGDVRKRALLLVGLAVVPTLLIGGALSEINERLLEIGLLGYAAVWALAGARMMGPAGSGAVHAEPGHR